MADPIEYQSIALRLPLPLYRWLEDVQEARRSAWIAKHNGTRPGPHDFSVQQYIRDILARECVRKMAAADPHEKEKASSTAP